MNSTGDAKTKRFSSIPGLEGFGLDMQRFLSNPAFHTRHRFALVMSEHENPVGRFYGGEALLDVAAADPGVNPKRRIALFDQAERVLTEAHHTIQQDNLHPAYIGQAAIDLADLTIRRQTASERALPDRQDRKWLKTVVDDELVQLANRMEDHEPSTHEYKSAIGVGAELAVRSLLDGFALESEHPFISVGSLLTEDLAPRRKRYGGKKGNWDVSTFSERTGLANKDVWHKIQVKNSGSVWQYADHIVPVSFERLPDEDEPPVDVWAFAHEIVCMDTGVSDGGRHDLYRHILAQNIGLHPYTPE